MFESVFAKTQALTVHSWIVVRQVVHQSNVQLLSTRPHVVWCCEHELQQSGRSLFARQASWNAKTIVKIDRTASVPIPVLA